jgi:peptidoglycan/LPS O-acetylase OafA/YrhL
VNFDNPIVVATLVVFALVAGAWLWHRFFSAEARWERRRRRSNRPVASKVKRPMVKFSVRTQRDRRE